MNPFAGGTEYLLAAAVREHAATFGETVVAAELEGRIPPKVIRDLAPLGVLGMTIPERDGGLGASAVAFALVLEELAAIWPALAVGVSVNGGIVAGSIVRHGTPEQRARWLPRLMDGNGLGAFALTEPTSGSDAASLRSRAARDGDGWVLSGQKLFVTNARYAPFAVVLARVGESEAGRPHAGITAFLAPLDSPGVRVGPPERKMGLLASDTSALTLQDVRLGREALLGEVGKGFAIAMSGLDLGRVGIAAQAVGIARGAVDRAVAYARQRRQFGKTIISYQAIRFALAGARAELDAARLLTLRAASLRDQGAPFGREASMAKLYASEAAQRATHVAVQVLGGYGYLREFAVERFERDARATTIYEGTSEIQRIVIARSLQREAA